MDTLGIQRLAEYALGLTPDQTDALIDAKIMTHRSKNALVST